MVFDQYNIFLFEGDSQEGLKSIFSDKLWRSSSPEGFALRRAVCWRNRRMVMRAGGGAAPEPLLIICRCRIRNSSSPWDNRVAGSPKRRTQRSVGVAQTHQRPTPYHIRLCALVLISPSSLTRDLVLCWRNLGAMTFAFRQISRRLAIELKRFSDFWQR